jgi:hypothetical protein
VDTCEQVYRVCVWAVTGRGDTIPHKYDAETFHTQPPGELVYPSDTGGEALVSNFKRLGPSSWEAAQRLIRFHRYRMPVRVST